MPIDIRLSRTQYDDLSTKFSTLFYPPVAPGVDNAPTSATGDGGRLLSLPGRMATFDDSSIASKEVAKLLVAAGISWCVWSASLRMALSSSWKNLNFIVESSPQPAAVIHKAQFDICRTQLSTLNRNNTLADACDRFDLPHEIVRDLFGIDEDTPIRDIEASGEPRNIGVKLADFAPEHMIAVMAIAGLFPGVYIAFSRKTVNNANMIRATLLPASNSSTLRPMYNRNAKAVFCVCRDIDRSQLPLAATFISAEQQILTGSTDGRGSVMPFM
ncbi:MAG: hypothetical protein LBC42_00415 [Puniceicoccales bacterium]|jgi:hypothetical protein|nr:hypothetical protein [Puniceicoccales bacterium]